VWTDGQTGLYCVASYAKSFSSPTETSLRLSLVVMQLETAQPASPANMIYRPRAARWPELAWSSVVIQPGSGVDGWTDLRRWTTSTTVLDARLTATLFISRLIRRHISDRDTLRHLSSHVTARVRLASHGRAPDIEQTTAWFLCIDTITATVSSASFNECLRIRRTKC